MHECEDWVRMTGRERERGIVWDSEMGGVRQGGDVGTKY